MAELRKYTSFEALKSDDTSGNVDRHKHYISLEFEAFLKRLQSEYYNKKKTRTDNGK